MAALWSTQAVVILAADFDVMGRRPLSYLATTSEIGFLFGVGLVVSAVLFVAFQWHLLHRYRLGVTFAMTMLVGMASQLIAGVVPIGGAGAASRVHVAAALTLGASIPLLMWRFAADQPAGAWRRRCYGLFWLEVAACAAGITLSQHHVAPLAEILPALTFHAWVLMATFGPTASRSGAPSGAVDRHQRARRARLGAAAPAIDVTAFRSSPETSASWRSSRCRLGGDPRRTATGVTAQAAEPGLQALGDERGAAVGIVVPGEVTA